MKHLALVRTALTLLVCGALWVAYAHAQQFGQSAAQQQLVKIADDLYVIHNDFVPGNTTALITDAGVMLVDDKFAIDHDAILAELRKVTDEPIRYVINTHHHSDHAGGNAKMQAMNVQVVVSEEARGHMEELPAGDPERSMPNVAFEGRLSLQLGGKRAELYQFGRAHTDGDVVVYFPAHKVLAAGDILTTDRNTPQFVDYAAGGSAKSWASTLDAALRLDFETVVPGHGAVANKAEMRAFRESVVRLRSRVHDTVVQKKTRADIAKMLQDEFHWVGAAGQMLMAQSFEGLLAELQ